MKKIMTQLTQFKQSHAVFWFKIGPQIPMRKYSTINQHINNNYIHMNLIIHMYMRILTSPWFSYYCYICYYDEHLCSFIYTYARVYLHKLIDYTRTTLNIHYTQTYCIYYFALTLNLLIGTYKIHNTSSIVMHNAQHLFNALTWIYTSPGYVIIIRMCAHRIFICACFIHLIRIMRVYCVLL